MFEVSKEGFASSAEFIEYVKKQNADILQDYSVYLENISKYRLKDPSNSEKHRAHIIVECADGRNSVMLFVPSEYLLNRFDIEWLPFAGNILFPEFAQFETLADWDAMQGNAEMMEMFFIRLDFLFGTKVKESLQEYKDGKLSKFFIEFQSHFDSHSESHGCGAHKSNLLAAQLETIKDGLVTEAWLQDRFSEAFNAGFFEVFRTTHDTSANGPIFGAENVDKSHLMSDEYGLYSELFTYAAEHFKSPVFKDSLKGQVRLYQGNPYGIDLAKHDEQVVCVSNLHFASMLSGQSSMEIAWTDSAETLVAHVKVLLSIIENNFHSRHQDKPTIVQFDLVKGDVKMLEVYKKVRAILDTDEDVRHKQQQGLLEMVTTETDRKTLELNFVN